MADFERAYKKTEEHEGFPGYVNDPHDPGGETVAGISRKHNPYFLGWDIVDQAKHALGPRASATLINRALAGATPFRTIVKEFYRASYWAPLHLDEESSQRLAEAVYDFGVNAGPQVSLQALEDARARVRKKLEEEGLL